MHVSPCCLLAGKIKRDNPDANEDVLLMSALRNMNLAKLVATDIPLFLALLADVFPVGDSGGSGASLASQHGEIRLALQAAAEKENVRFYELSGCLVPSSGLSSV